MFLDDLTTKLVAAGVGTISGSSKNIFSSSGAAIPSGAGPYLIIVETGGFAPTRIHNKPGAATQRPTAQLTVVAGAGFPTARAMASAAYTALDGIWNTTINGVFYQKIVALQEPTDVGPEPGTNRAMVVFNLEAQKEPS